MITFMRAANREESAKFFAESPNNLCIMVNDANGDYVKKDDYLALKKKLNNLLYELDEKLEEVKNEIGSAIYRTYEA